MAQSTASRAYRLDQVNGMEQQEFIQALGDIFEHSPEVAEQAWSARPFRTVDGLHEAMMAGILRRDTDDCKAFLGRHPELSAEALRGRAMAAASVAEQSGAGLDGLTDAEEAHLQQLNRAYRTRYGFPFIICLRHYTKDGIFFELESRVDRGERAELDYALSQIRAITRYRLAGRVVA